MEGLVAVYIAAGLLLLIGLVLGWLDWRTRRKHAH